MRSIDSKVEDLTYKLLELQNRDFNPPDQMKFMNDFQKLLKSPFLLNLSLTFQALPPAYYSLLFEKREFFKIIKPAIEMIDFEIDHFRNYQRKKIKRFDEKLIEVLEYERNIIAE